MEKLIYILDDNDEYSIYLKKILELNNYIVKAFKSAGVLFDSLNSTNIFPDLILIDLSMPNLNGYDVIKYLNSNDKLKSINKFIVSAKSEFKSHEEFKDIEFVKKPIDEKNFIKRVNSVTRILINEVEYDYNKYVNSCICCYLLNYPFYGKIIITKLFVNRVEFNSDIRFSINSKISLFSRNISDLIEMSKEFEIIVKKTSSEKNIYSGIGEFDLLVNNDLLKLKKYIDSNCSK